MLEEECSHSLVSVTSVIITNSQTVNIAIPQVCYFLYVVNQTCPSGHRKCPNSDHCISVDSFCDGDDDCDDSSDENTQLCGKTTISSNYNIHCVQKKHPLLFSCITLRKSNQFE